MENRDRLKSKLKIFLRYDIKSRTNSLDPFSDITRDIVEKDAESLVKIFEEFRKEEFKRNNHA